MTARGFGSCATASALMTRGGPLLTILEVVVRGKGPGPAEDRISMPTTQVVDFPFAEAVPVRPPPRPQPTEPSI